MNQFVVPQFIDVQAKIIGPVTVRQFVISLCGGFFAVLAYKMADTGLFIILLLIDGGIVFLLGFFKVNGRPFNMFLVSVFETLKRPPIRVWKPTYFIGDTTVSLSKNTTQKRVAVQGVKQKQLTASRLQELSLVVDTGGMYTTDEE